MLSAILNAFIVTLVVGFFYVPDLYAAYKSQIWPIQRSVYFAQYSMDPGPLVAGDPCHPRAYLNPLLDAAGRAQDCHRVW